jgi:hypothetical protein
MGKANGGSGQSPKERYEHDAAYKHLTDSIERLIVEAQFTPSEVRECAVLACIHYEMRYGFNHYLQSVPYKVNAAFAELESYRKTGDYSEQAQRGSDGRRDDGQSQ